MDQALAIVRKIAEQLSRTERLVILLRYGDGLSDREIAGLVDLEPEEVSWTLTQLKALFGCALKLRGL